MACKYTYKNITMSEDELDDLLLGFGKNFLDTFGDKVFSAVKPDQQEVFYRLVEINKQGSAIRHENILEKINYDDNDLGNFKIKEGTYKPVTHYLEGLRSKNEKLLFPEFIVENYFKERRKEWIQGKFTVKEKTLLFPEDNIPEVVTEEMMQSFETQIQEMWDAQGKIGTEIHKGMQYYFSGSGMKGNSIQHRDLPDNVIKKQLRDKLDPNLITDSHINQILEYCKNLHNTLKSIYKSSNLIYFTELPIWGEVLDPKTEQEDNLLGMVDLLVIDDLGNTHIIDYKTSPADYGIEVPMGDEIPFNAYSPAKKLAFGYQLNVYNRLLTQLGVTPTSSDVNVAPIQLSNFRKDGDRFIFDSIIPYSGFIDNLTLKTQRDQTINENLDQMFKEEYLINTDAGKIISNVNEIMGQLFHNKIKRKSEEEFTDFINTKRYTEEDIKEIMKDRVEEIPNVGFEFTLGKLKITAKTKEKLIKEVYNKLNSKPRNIAKEVNRFKILINSQNLSNYETSSKVIDEKSDVQWIPELLKPYCNGNYRVVNLPKQFDQLGILLLENIETNNFEILKLSNNYLKTYLKMGGRTNLTGRFEEDIVEDSNSNSLMLKGIYGNVELIETLLALNQIPKVFAHRGSIGKIQVINPEYNIGLSASNKELLYSYKKLIEHLPEGKLEHDFIKDGTIKFQSKAQVFRDSLQTLIKNSNENSKIRTFESACSGIEELIPNPQELLYKLEDLKTQMEETNPNLKNSDISQVHSEEERVYFELNQAIAEVSGFDFRQQTYDPDNYIDSWNIRKGHSGLMTDNPGITANQNLNMVTQVVTQAYQNVRSNMQEAVAKLRELNENLKKSKGFNYIEERLYGNKVNLYRNMYKRTSNGDWVFVDPNTLSNPAERAFLEYTLATINANRYKNLSVEKLIEMRNSRDVGYFRVPLAAGGSVWQVSGAMHALKNTLKGLAPEEIKRRFKEKINNLMTDDSPQEQRIQKNAQWEMTTLFDGGEIESNRLRLLNDKNRPEGYYEHNLEKLVLKHIYSYTLKQEMDKVFPLIKAAQIHQIFSQISQNTKFENSLKYLQNYVKVSIFNKPILKDRDIIIKEYADKLMHTASVQALGFAPRQMYQIVEGLWKDIGLIFRQPDGTEINGQKHFEFQHLRDSFFNTFRELTHFGNKRSKLELLNELYALNDMDMNVYAQHLEDGHNLFYNFSTFLFRMASRPDFYNRLTIFQSQMRADGTWDAYSEKNGKLIYDWSKDKRFDQLAKGNKNHPDYKKQEVLYLEMANQMIKEGTRNADGTLFTIRDENGNYNPLPKAYTTQQSESYKALSDMMYGYYSHEKRSLMQATLLGGLFMQMYTYWSGKKNQFLAPGSIKNQGKYIHVEQNGKKLFYQLKPNGEINFDAPLTDKNTGAPVIQWQGTFSEGIITTLANIGTSLYNGLRNGETANSVWHKYWDNPNENLKTAYRQNLTQLGWDTFVFLGIGGIIGSMMTKATNDYFKENKDDKTAEQVFKNTSLMLATNIFKASTLDFNAAESIFGRGMSWTPFSFSMYENTLKNWNLALHGKRNFRDAVINSFSATRQTKPLWQKLFPDDTEN